MRIAQIAPLAEAVPPELYGGTERVVSWLTEALIEQGHEVTLFASADSRTSGRLIPCAPHSLRLAGINNHVASHLAMLDQALRMADEFDLMHFHIDALHFPVFRHLAYKCLTTLHGRQDLADYWPAYQTFPEMKLVAVSDEQRVPVPDANFVGTVHHGTPPDLIPFEPEGGDYLVFIGRISPEKRPDRAIEIARMSQRKLRIAAKVDPYDRVYFREQIKPLLASPWVEFLGEIDDTQKPRFFGEACALLFPIDWPEPFGLSIIEAMSAGTPTISWRQGAAPEILEDGRNGFLVESIDEAVAAVEASAALPRQGVRAAFERRFTAARMAADYLALYEKAIGPGRKI
ncbi:MAG TPA: glycosyltransferase family 4 protein [Allosphingosinicella sp.]|nr:glycosyltransferase family 4 protein [Allosphingosinicella sp.]